MSFSYMVSGLIPDQLLVSVGMFLRVSKDLYLTQTANSVVMKVQQIPGEINLICSRSGHSLILKCA